MNYKSTKIEITKWLLNYAKNANQKGYIIGISGGIDSAVCSTLCALTGLQIVVVRIPIHQVQEQSDRGSNHIEWLKNKFSNITSFDADLSEIYDKEIELLTKSGIFDQKCTSAATLKSRLRTTVLYGLGGANNLLVCGCGNKVEDYGVGFCAKSGDLGVDVNPIGDLLKSEVFSLGKELGIIQEIIDAKPTDGLWEDGRTDEDQIGATYDELEWALKYHDKLISTPLNFNNIELLSDRQRKVLEIYTNNHYINAHKMCIPPICDLSNLKNEKI